MVPVVETPRLRLRSFETRDFEAHAATMSDERVVRHLGGTAFSREESWRRILMCTGLWPLLGYGYWTVERRDDRTWIGLVGFADFKREMTPSIEGLPEMGWIFAPEAQGHGFASEAVAAGLEWAGRTLGAAEIPAIIDPENAPSIRVAQKAGFSSCENAVYRGAPILLVRRTAVQGFSARK